MKRLASLILCTCIASLDAQDLSGLILKADYSLINTAEDATGLQDSMTLVNAPYAGAQGVYSNGNYLNSDPDSCVVWTPFLATLFDTVFAIQLEFQPLPPDGVFRPVVVAGDSWRYLILATIGGKFRVSVNDLSNYRDLESPLPVSGQWYTATIIHDQLAERSEFYLDGERVATLDGALNRTMSDGRLSNTHFGAGKAFKGYWRNLKFYGSDPLSAMTFAEGPGTSWSVCPNPTGSLVRIMAPPEGSSRWALFATDGHWVSSGSMEGGDLSIDLAAVPPGIYTLVLQGQAGAWYGTRRVVRLGY